MFLSQVIPSKKMKNDKQKCALCTKCDIRNEVVWFLCTLVMISSTLHNMITIGFDLTE